MNAGPRGRLIFINMHAFELLYIHMYSCWYIVDTDMAALAAIDDAKLMVMKIRQASNLKSTPVKGTSF